MLGACAGADRESYTDRLAGIPLLTGEFQSYSSEQQIRAALSASPILDVERSGLNPGDRRPPYDIVRLAVAEYEHLGVSGELSFVLFNDRLMNVWFYPADVEAYMVALAKRDVAVTTELAGKPAVALRVRSQSDVRGRACVVWSDGRLEDQSARWISRYS
jgi:hypothetical protein